MLSDSLKQSISQKKIYELVNLIINTNLELCNNILTEYLKINQDQDQQILEYLNQIQFNSYISKQDVNTLTNFLSILALSYFGVSNLIQRENEKIVNQLIADFKDNRQFQQLLINFVRLSKKNKNLVRMASNAIYLLVKMNVQLYYLDFSWIQIEDTDISQGNFAGCNLNNSKFRNVKISGLNLNGASLQNVEWLQSSVLEQQVIITKEEVDKLALISKSNIVVSFSEQGNIINFWSFLNGSLIRCIRPKQKIHSFDLSVNGLIALGSNSISFYQAQTGRMTSKFGKLLDDEEDVYFILDFSLDGSLLASGNYNNQIKIWDCMSQQTIQIIKHQASSFCRSLSIKNNNNYVISTKQTYSKKSLLMWNIQSGILEKVQDDAYVDIQCFHYDPEFLVIGTADPDVQMWDKDQKKLPSLRGRGYGTNRVAYHKGKNILATGSYDHNIILWNSTNWQRLATLTGHLAKIKDLQFTSNGLNLISCSKDKTIRIWDLRQIYKQNLIGNEIVYFQRYYVNKNQKQLLLYSHNSFQKGLHSFQFDKRRNYFDFQIDTIIETFSTYDSIQFDFSFKNQYLILLTQAAICIKILDEPNSQVIRLPTKKRLYRFGMLKNQIGVAIDDKYIQYTNIRNQKCLQQVWMKKNEEEFSLFQICQKKKIIAIAQFSILKFWKMNKVIFKFDRQTQISLIQLSINGNYLLLQGNMGELEIWSVNNRKIVSYLKGHQQSTICAQFTPNEKIIVTASYCFTMRFWDVLTGTQLFIINFNESQVQEMQISQDINCNNCELYVSNGCMLQIWNLGDCNVNQFQPICYNQYSNKETPFTADYANISGAIITNERNKSLLGLLQYKINENQKQKIQD